MSNDKIKKNQCLKKKVEGKNLSQPMLSRLTG
jgi:hypothetical protein